MPLNIESYIDQTKREKIVKTIQEQSLFADKEFEILSTIRYDPNLFKGNTKFDKILSSNDTSLSKIDELFLFDENVDLVDIITDDLSLKKKENHENDQYIDMTKANEQELMEIFYHRFFLLGEHLKRLQFTMDYFNMGEYEVDLK